MQTIFCTVEITDNKTQLCPQNVGTWVGILCPQNIGTLGRKTDHQYH